MKWQRLTVYVDVRDLKARAAAWAKAAEEATGARVPQPVSAYVRWLISKDAKRRVPR